MKVAGKVMTTNGNLVSLQKMDYLTVFPSEFTEI